MDLDRQVGRRGCPALRLGARNGNRHLWRRHLAALAGKTLAGDHGAGVRHPGAGVTVGATLAARWKWFTDFAERPLPDGGAAEQQQLLAEVEVFSLGAVPAAGSALVSYTPPSADDLPQLQRLAAQVVNHVRTAGAWRWFPLTAADIGVWAAPGKLPGTLTVASMLRTNTAADLFLSATSELHARLNGTLRLCLATDCGRPFVFSRSHQRFCSTRCQNRAGLARYVARHGGQQGIAKKRGEQYYARQAKRLGHRTLVRRRQGLAVHAHDHAGGKSEQPYAAHQDFILFLARTGVRLGEALAVRWGDIDFVTKTVRIQLNWVRRELTTPKNYQQRTIDLSSQLVAALAVRFEHLGNVVGISADEETALAESRAALLDQYVFGDGRTPMDGDNFRKRVWESLCVVAKVGKIRIHDLRHSYASQLIRAGKPIHCVQQQCGHHSPEFTMSQYGHLFPRDQRQNVDLLDDAQTNPQSAHADAPRRTQLKKRRAA